jgi:hypothetical protein
MLFAIRHLLFALRFTPSAIRHPPIGVLFRKIRATLALAETQVPGFVARRFRH